MINYYDEADGKLNSIKEKQEWDTKYGPYEHALEGLSNNLGVRRLVDPDTAIESLKLSREARVESVYGCETISESREAEQLNIDDVLNLTPKISPNLYETGYLLGHKGYSFKKEEYRGSKAYTEKADSSIVMKRIK